MTPNPTRLDLRHAAVGPWPMNTYALVCPTTNQSVLVDPGAEPETLLKLLGDSEPVAILLTHAHPDHIGALEEMRERLAVPLMAYDAVHGRNQGLRAERGLAHGDTVKVGAHGLRVFHTPGHSDDMLCFVLEGDTRAIVGDTLFAGGPGRTWSAEGFRETLRTLRDIVLPWPNATVLYPGHGPSFRLGDLRPRIEGFLARKHGAFFGDAEWDA